MRLMYILPLALFANAASAAGFDMPARQCDELLVEAYKAKDAVTALAMGQDAIVRKERNPSEGLASIQAASRSLFTATTAPWDAYIIFLRAYCATIK